MARHTRRKGAVGQTHTRWNRVGRYAESEVFLLLVICFLAAGTMIFARGMPLYGSGEQKEPARMLFVGDIMLARNVERLMDAHGASYPFKGIRDMLDGYEVAIGNFEASIPERHARTPSFGFTFSITKDAAAALSRVGFTDMTLANNHAYDHGKEGYTHTREVLTNAGITVGGNPRALSGEEVIYHTIDDVQIAIIPINTIVGAPTLEQMQATLGKAGETSDMQVISIHWGDEYKSIANESQRELARVLVDAGADAIIGHHPHVVQEVEEYRGVPIFYSLGNFIFDQYWNNDVQEGLTVALSFDGDDVHYALIPVTSLDTRSAPRPMNRVERTQFLDELSSRSEKVLTDAIREGTIVEIFR